MCFSAPASFAVSAGLFITGVIAAKQARTIPQLALASVPLIFFVQQLSEGFLWLALQNTVYAHWQNISMYVFLVFAQVVWPSFVPALILLFEKNPLRKKILYLLLAVGVLTSVYLSYCLLAYPISAIIDGHHIKYDLGFPESLRLITGAAYLMAAVISPFVSSLKNLRYLGMALLASYLVSRIFYNDYLISVWCYFAAVISLFMLVIIRQLKKQAATIFG